jgi:hypothetical protein|tara:strand:+ start:857 stop:1495 length:639 start_codon:yes stop_codon:yes gene_type:complete
MKNTEDLDTLTEEIEKICDSDDDDSISETEIEIEPEEIKREMVPVEPIPKDEVCVDRGEKTGMKTVGNKRGPYRRRKTQVIYQVVDTEGKILDRKTQSQVKKPTKAQLKAEAYDIEAEEMSKKLGYMVKRLKNGKPVEKKPRSEAQIKATQQLISNNKLRAANKLTKKIENRKNELVEAVKQVAMIPKAELKNKSKPIDIPVCKPTLNSLLG